MSTRTLCILVMLLFAATGRAAAQDFGLKLAAGPAHGHEFGGAALAAAQVRYNRLLVRADLQLTATGESASWERSARVLSLGASAGIASDVTAASRWYALASVSDGLDLREADKVTALGALVGWEAPSVPLFTELRYEHWLQRGVRHYDLPGNTVRLLIGLVIL
jgi:hypothetical protein